MGHDSGKWRSGGRKPRVKGLKKPARHLASREQENYQGRDSRDPALGRKKLSVGDDSWKRALKVITGGRGWEKAESQGPREAGPPFGEPGGGKFSGAGSFESRPSKREEEVKTGKRALKAETGRRVGRRGRVKGVEKEGGQKRNRPAKWRAGRREILGPKPRLPTAGWSAPIRRRRYQGRDLWNPALVSKN